MTKTIIIVISLIILFSCSPSKSGMDLIEAVKANDIEKVKKIADAENINSTDETGATPVMWAAYNGNVEVLDFLVKKGADCKKQGIISIDNNKKMYGSPLNAAVGEGYLNAVKFLVEKCSVDVNEQSNRINRFYFNPDEIINPEGLLEFIKKSGDKISEKLKTKRYKEGEILSVTLTVYLNQLIIGDNLSGYQASSNESSFLKMIENRKFIDDRYGQFIVKKKNYEHLDNIDGFFKPVISYASGKNAKEIVRFLVEHGADVNREDSEGWTPLHVYSSRKDYEITEILLKNGADAKKVDKFLKYSTIEGFYSIPDRELEKEKEKIKDITLKLIKAGANVNNQNIFGETILFIVCREKVKDLAEFLVSVGADPDKEIAGKKTGDFCKEKGIDLVLDIVNKDHLNEKKNGENWSDLALNKMNWYDAMVYCEGLEENECSDWRLPTISELRMLVKNCSETETEGSCKVADNCLASSCFSLSCGGSFVFDDGRYSKLGDTQWLWSKSEQSDKENYAWSLFFAKGGIVPSKMDGLKDVRCIKQ